MARFWLSNDSFFKTMDKGCVMLKSQFSQKTWYFSENPFVPGNGAEKNKSMLVEQFSGCSNELKLIKNPLTGCKLIQM